MSNRGSPKPPVAARRPVALTHHGDTRVDPYAWLRGEDDPAVLEYLTAENVYSDAMLAPTLPLREELYREMVSHLKETDLSVPFPEGGFFYYSRTEEGKQYAIHCRRPKEPDSVEQVIFDLNEMAAGGPYLDLGDAVVSDDGARIAYTLDRTGYRQYTLFVKEIATGAVSDPVAERVTSVAWAADGRTLFYTVEDDAKRSHRLWRQTTGTPRYELLYEEKDERFSVDVSRSRSRQYLFLAIASHTTGETWFLRADTPESDLRVIVAREQDHEYDVAHRGGEFFIRTNGGGRCNFRIVRAPLDDPGPTHWAEVVPHRSEVMIEDFDLFARHLVLYERSGGLERISIHDLKTAAVRSIEFPEPAYALSSEPNREFDATRLRYGYESFVTPASVIEFDMDEGRSVLLKRTEVPGYDPSLYISERIEAAAPDGTTIPISLVRRRDLTANSPGPVHLLGYGAYGISSPVVFRVSRIPLLDRGITCAIAHIRGGGEMGKVWHDAGRMQNKQNTFLDFIAAADHLVATGRTLPDRLTIEGRSAGGLLIGACVNLRPELFRAAIAGVPFVDVLTTMLDSTLPLTVGEYEEWGDPNRPEDYFRIKSYSPYDNLSARAYPAMLVKVAIHDSQVPYWEGAKFVAKLRVLTTGRGPILLHANLDAGHSGASGRYDRLGEAAFDAAFLLWQLDGCR